MGSAVAIDDLGRTGVSHRASRATAPAGPWAALRRVGQRLVEAVTDVFMGARTYRGSVMGLFAALALRPSTRS